MISDDRYSKESMRKQKEMNDWVRDCARAAGDYHRRQEENKKRPPHWIKYTVYLSVSPTNTKHIYVCSKCGYEVECPTKECRMCHRIMAE